ncbi:MAG TPA: hypothetical protein VF627_11410 [Abditibacterium sp.]
MEITLRRRIIATFAVTFVLIVATIVIWKLKFYDAVNAQLVATDTAYTAAKAEADKLPAAVQDEAQAKENLALAQAEMESFRSRFRALSFDLTDAGRTDRTWRGYMTEYSSGYGIAVRNELLQAAQDAGVTINTSLKVDAPPQVPEAIVAPTSGFLKPVSGGNLSIEAVGAFPDLLNFFERVNRSPILMTVGAVRLEGASPQITATFTVTPYLLATGPSIQLAGGAPAPATDAAAGGAPGGPPGGAADGRPPA